MSMRFVFLLLFIPSLQGLSAQEEQDSTLCALYTAIMDTRTDAERLEASDAFKSALKKSLFKPGAMEHPYACLNMCKLKAPDGRFRIFNWNVPLNSGEERYEALLVIPKGRSGMVDVVEMTDMSAKLDRPEDKVLRPDKWFGALYYEIIPFKKGGGEHYLLLAWDGDSRITNRKVIDVISFSGRSIRLGAPVFKTERGLKKRLIFTYSEQSSMSLVYQPKEKRIVYDHLAPKESRLEGQYQFYGPDMSFDALNYKKGKWEWESNVEFKRQRTDKDKDFNDPRIK